MDTVARGGLDDLPRLTQRLGTVAPAGSRARMRTAPPLFAVAYPLLLALASVRRFRLTDLRQPCPGVRALDPDPEMALRARIDDQLWPRFGRADCEANLAANCSAARSPAIARKVFDPTV